MANWYLKKFENRLAELYALRENATGESLIKIQETIDTLLGLMFLDSEEQIPCNLQQILDYEFESLSFFSSIWHVVEPMATEEVIPHVAKYYYSPKLKDDEIVGLVYDFCKDSLDRELFKKVRGILKKSKEYVNMRRLFLTGPRADAIYLQYYDQVYIRLKRRGDYRDLTSLSHEIGHGLQFKTNYSENLFSTIVPFSEVVSLFFELLSAEYFSSLSEFKKPMIQKRIMTFNDFQEKSSYFWEEIEFFWEWQKRNKRMDTQALDEICKIVGEKCGIEDYSVIDIEFILSQEIMQNFPYCVSYVIAIELLEVYRKDKDLALYLLKKFMSLDLNLSIEDYYSKMLDLGLIPGERLPEYKEYLMRPIKQPIR